MTVFQCPHRQIEGGDRIQHQQHGAVMRILQDNQCKDQSVSGMWYALSKTSGALDVSRGDASKMLGTVPSTRKSSATAVKCYLRYPLPTPRHLPDPVTGMSLTESPLTSLTTPQEGFTCRLACAPPSLGCDHRIFSSSHQPSLCLKILISPYSPCPNHMLTGDFHLGWFPASGTDLDRAPSWGSWRDCGSKTPLRSSRISLKSQQCLSPTPEQGRT